MPVLHVYGIDHSRAPLATREEWAMEPAQILAILPTLLFSPGRRHAFYTESMLVVTCNRTELYLVEADGAGPAGTKPDFFTLLRASGKTSLSVRKECSPYHVRGAAAIRHLYAVAASLRSPVAGDTQIAQQIGAAMELAETAGTLGPLLRSLVEGALRSAKRVRRETGLMAGHGGVGPAVLTAIRRFHIPGSTTGDPVRVLLLGTGAMAKEVAAHLLRARGFASPLLGDGGWLRMDGVWGRDIRKASRFASIHGTCAVSELAAIRLISQVDAVVGACRGRVDLLAASRLRPILETRKTPLTVIDLGVPRNLDPLLAGARGLHSVSLDYIHYLVRERTRCRAESLARAAGIVEEEAMRLDRWWTEIPLRPMRAEIYSAVESVLSRWRPDQPGAVRQLRISIHRSLQQTFRSVLPVNAGGSQIA